MVDPTQEALSRRAFLLRLLGLTGIAGALALGGPSSVKAAESKPDPVRGYRETEHIRRYYQTARF